MTGCTSTKIKEQKEHSQLIVPGILILDPFIYSDWKRSTHAVEAVQLGIRRCP